MSNTPRGLPLTSSRVQDIFPKLTTAQISRVSAHGHMRALHAGEVLYEQGDIAVPFFVAVSGEPWRSCAPSAPLRHLSLSSALVNSRGRLTRSPVDALSFVCMPVRLVR